MPRSARRLGFKLLAYVGLPVALAATGYGFIAKQKLGAMLEKEGVKEYSVSSFTLAGAEKKDGAASQALRVAVKRSTAPNWRPYKEGLVHGVYDWSLRGMTWQAVPPTPEEAQESLKLRLLEPQTPGQLIDALDDKDAYSREAASALLRARTGKDFGYRHDRPPESQKEAIESWRRWWEANKVSWTAGKVLEGVGEILKK